MNKPVIPCIHLNGTPGDRLCDQYYAARRALHDAGELIQNIEFNARDYYPLGPEAWDQATKERQALQAKLKEIIVELETIEIGISDQLNPTR